MAGVHRGKPALSKPSIYIVSFVTQTVGIEMVARCLNNDTDLNTQNVLAESEEKALSIYWRWRTALWITMLPLLWPTHQKFHKFLDLSLTLGKISHDGYQMPLFLVWLFMNSFVAGDKFQSCFLVLFTLQHKFKFSHTLIDRKQVCQVNISSVFIYQVPDFNWCLCCCAVRGGNLHLCAVSWIKIRFFFCCNPIFLPIFRRFQVLMDAHYFWNAHSEKGFYPDAARERAVIVHHHLFSDKAHLTCNTIFNCPQ